MSKIPRSPIQLRSNRNTPILSQSNSQHDDDNHQQRHQPTSNPHDNHASSDDATDVENGYDDLGRSESVVDITPNSNNSNNSHNINIDYENRFSQLESAFKQQINTLRREIAAKDDVIVKSANIIEELKIEQQQQRDKIDLYESGRKLRMAAHDPQHDNTADDNDDDDNKQSDADNHNTIRTDNTSVTASNQTEFIAMMSQFMKILLAKENVSSSESKVKSESSNNTNAKSHARKPDDFSADPKSDIILWLNQLENWLELENITDDQRKIAHARMYLKDTAAIWILQKTFSTFDEFKSSITRRFQSCDKAKRAADEIDRARQGKFTVQQYTNYFQQRLNMLNDKFKLNNDEQIRKYMNGLHFNIQRMMIGRKFDSFEECSSCAMQLEQSWRRIQPRTNNQRDQNDNGSNSNARTSKSDYNRSNANQNRNSNSRLNQYDNNNTESTLHQMNDNIVDQNEIEGVAIDQSLNNVSVQSQRELSQLEHAYLNAISRQVNRSRNEIDQMRRKGQCFKCGERNHLIKECPSLQQSKNVY
jgi:hypothetical protein